jgi:hypothetical protein
VNLAARYATAVCGLALVALAVGALLPAPLRGATWRAVAVALPVQAPLGWWLVRALGTDRLLHAWGAGMMGRVVLLAGGAWVVAPVAGVPAGPLLLALAAVLLGLLGAEVALLWYRVRHDGVR